MKFNIYHALLVWLVSSFAVHAEEWEILFDESTGLKNWKIAENTESIRLEDKMMVLNGNRAHAFYMGPKGDASWKNFEAVIEFKTFKKANAGLFFHTQWQEKGWPSFGLECQINATHGDWRKTGSIYAIKDVKEPGHKDGEWVTMILRVENNVATVFVNGKETNKWVQPKEHTWKKKRINEGTFAFQAHDPESKAIIRSFKVKRLP